MARKSTLPNNPLKKPSINGITISQEAIDENKKEHTIDTELINNLNYSLNNIDFSKINDYVQMYLEDATPKYIKKTMIISEQNLAMINGIASSKKMQIKDVLNQLLDYAIANLDEETLTEAYKSIGENETNKDIKLF